MNDETGLPPFTSAFVAAEARRASERLDGRVRETPLDHSPAYSQRLGANVYFKLENLQHTGSFKLRGAMNRILTLGSEQRDAGVVAASSGNHGAAVAWAMRAVNVSGVIFVPEQTASTKVDAIRSYGGDVRFFGTDGLDTELHAREFALEHGMTYLSPYNDPAVVAGQGSCGVEISRQLDDIDAVLVAVGGGGLIGGIGSVLKEDGDVQIIGCQPANSAVMARSMEAGHILDMPSDATLSDGTAGGIEDGAITFELCRNVVDRFVVVDEDAIAAAMREFMDAQHQLVEGAAGVALAALEDEAAALAGKNVVVVICGSNISRDKLRQVIC